MMARWWRKINLGDILRQGMLASNSLWVDIFGWANLACLKLLESVSYIRLRNDGVALKDAPGSPAANFHNDTFRDAGASQIARCRAAQIMEEKAG
jgi:hypothetical protein